MKPNKMSPEEIERARLYERADRQGGAPGISFDDDEPEIVIVDTSGNPVKREFATFTPDELAEFESNDAAWEAPQFLGEDGMPVDMRETEEVEDDTPAPPKDPYRSVGV